MLKPLLIEIGVEELPAVPLLKELKNIEKKYADILEKNSLLCEFDFYYTPRRLVIYHAEFKTHQEDSVEEFFGAPISLAYKDGEPTPAAKGFAKKCGVDLSEIGRGKKGAKEVLYYKKNVKGKSSLELLSSIIKEWLKSLEFGKSMRWGNASESFIRPIRWLNVMLGNDLVDVTLFGVASKKITFVHRIANFEALEVSSIKEYFSTLKNGGVTLFADTRREKILNNFDVIEKENDFKIEIDEDLLDEVVAITENPTALLGSFDANFLRLPPEVIITSMKEHQRYFPVFKNKKLINKFIVVSNALTDDFSKVIEGNEKVLRPRLADGLFFYNNDLKNGLSTAGLEKVAFFKGLGTLGDKIQRELKIANSLFDIFKLDGDKTDLNRAVELAKADLMSEMVYEFTELQGLMGGYYASASGESEEVVTAIKQQYLPNGEDSEVPSTPLSAIVAMSLKLDTLLALFSVKEIPTGSRDPFALRRAVNGIIRISVEHEFEFDILKILTHLSTGYAEIDMQKLENFFLERVKQYFKSVNPSIIEAVLVTGEREVLTLGKKIQALNNIVNSEGFTEYFTTFKRVANITKDVDLLQPLFINKCSFEFEAEAALFDKYTEITSSKYENYELELDALLGLKPQLDRFFEEVMVNVDNEVVKKNRKFLIASVYKSILKIADIKEVSV